MPDPLFLRQPAHLVTSLWTHRRLIWQLALHDLRARYAATVVGSVWAIVNPLILILVFWFVSAHGLRITRTTGRSRTAGSSILYRDGGFRRLV